MGKLRHTGRGVNRKGHRAPTNRGFTEASCQWVTRGGRVTHQEKVGKHTRRQEQFPATREEKNPAHKGKDHALHSRQTLPALQQTCTEKHTCSHTHTGTQSTHTRAGTQTHTQAFLWWTPEQASCQVNPRAAGQCPARLGVGRGPAPSRGASAAAGWGGLAGPQAAAMWS